MHLQSAIGAWQSAIRFGPIAQRLEPPAHNRPVPGSNPGGPTNFRSLRSLQLVGPTRNAVSRLGHSVTEPGSNESWLHHLPLRFARSHQSIASLRSLSSEHRVASLALTRA